MKKTVQVTDHAVLRYLERAYGLDIDAVRQHIAGRALTGVDLGATAVIIERVKLVIIDRTVVTVYKRSWPSRNQNVTEANDVVI